MTKKLYRSTDQRMIAGVCGGIAEYFNIDPTIVRLVMALTLIPGGVPGVLLYGILWIVIPQNPTGRKQV